jgi:hypothetical protein
MIFVIDYHVTTSQVKTIAPDDNPPSLGVCDWKLSSVISSRERTGFKMGVYAVKKLSRVVLVMCLGVACIGIAVAQETSIPKVLQITGEYTKPGRAHMLHDKTEGVFVQAMARAKWPVHYLGMISLSGRKRALFLTWYPSFEAWEQSDKALSKNTALSDVLSRAYIADGEMVDSEDQHVFVYHEELSLHPITDISQMRYMDISIYHVRPGHDSEWNDLVKMVKDAYEKAVPEAHWAMYEQVYGGDGGTYFVVTARKSLAELDRTFNEDDRRFKAAMSEDAMKKFKELVGASVESYQHQLFAFNPNTSYVADEWIKADNFWKPKAVSAPSELGTHNKRARP